MKQPFFSLQASMALALFSVPLMLFAQSERAAVDASEAPRVTQVVSTNSMRLLPSSHVEFSGVVEKAVDPLPDSAQMAHLQLVLRPSALRQSSLEAMITSQHDPKSAMFHHWLSPTQFGDAFGVSQSDIVAVTSWLSSQGFTVNGVYPNKMQIDFSGSAGQVRQAFRTQENFYTVDGVRHLANSSDISVPSALSSVITGVVGLDDIRAKAQAKPPAIAHWDASKKAYVLAASSRKVVGQAVYNNNSQARGLVPNDLSTMYDIRPIRANGITGQGITIAVVDDQNMVPGDWTNFVNIFNLARYGGTFSQIQPAPPSGSTNCVNPNPSSTTTQDNIETVIDAEWSAAIAPGAHIVVATCADYSAADPVQPTDNFYGGVLLAAANLINQSSGRPNIISVSYGQPEIPGMSVMKTSIDQLWAQADAEGISVFVSAGDSGSSAGFNDGVIGDDGAVTGVRANAYSTSPHVTAVGGTDTADVLEGTTSQYFAATPSVVGGSALSYVPEIPWNQSCGNGVAAKAFGYASAIDFCRSRLTLDPQGDLITSEAAGGAPSIFDAKPAWQGRVFNAAQDQSRDTPDVALFAGSFGASTFAIVCTQTNPCTTLGEDSALIFGTSLASPMFAGVQALIDQGLVVRGLPADQGNAAPTLYALAAQEYGPAGGPAAPSLAACDANNGATGTAACVFHNVTSGATSSQCEESGPNATNSYVTSHCYIYGTLTGGEISVGLTTSDAAPTSYGVGNKAFGAAPGWSFASGLGSVDARNLLIAWRAFVNAPPAAAATASYGVTRGLGQSR
jgi:subtilase family serine protease